VNLGRLHKNIHYNTLNMLKTLAYNFFSFLILGEFLIPNLFELKLDRPKFRPIANFSL